MCYYTQLSGMVFVCFLGFLFCFIFCFFLFFMSFLFVFTTQPHCGFLVDLLEAPGGHTPGRSLQ